MRLKIGDKVRYLNEVGEGRVTKIVNNTTVEILNEYGFEVPVLEKELVAVDVAETEFVNRSSEEKVIEVDNNIEAILEDNIFEEELPEIENNDTEVLLGVVKEEKFNNFFIINDSDFNLYVNILKQKNDKFINIFSSKLEAGMKENFIEFPINEVKEGVNLIFQLLFIAKSQESVQSPVEKIISIPAVKFFKNGVFKENDYFHEDALILPIFQYGLKNEIEKLTKEDIKKIIKEKQESEKYTKELSTKYKTQKSIEITEVDLHIQEVLDNINGLSNTEMLMAQMDKFHSEMKTAIEKRVNKVVFIHGVGNGTLKNEVRKSLQNDYPKYKFQDASFKEYGFGATMVYIN